MRLRTFTGYFGLPVLSLAGFFLALRAIPPEQDVLLYGERGLIELATAALFLIAGVAAGLLVWKRGSASWFWRLFYGLLGLGCLFIALEETSYGQHLMGWEATSWFAQHNHQRETNLHNLYGNQASDRLRQFFGLGYVGAFLVLPVLCLPFKRACKPGHWTYYLFPRGELMTLAMLDLLLRGLRRLPEPMLDSFWRVQISEIREFYWGVAVVLYVLLLWRRLSQPRAISTALATARRMAA